MKLGKLEVQPVMLYLPDTEKWVNRANEGERHFNEVGITDILKVAGIYGEGFGIEGTHLYEYDNPGGKHQIGVANTALFLSMHIVYAVELNHKADYFLFLEDDSRFQSDWKELVEKAMEDLPDDFDFLFIGSCCAEGKGSKKISSNKVHNLYHYPYKVGRYANYPLCGNAYIVAKKALPTIIATQRDAYVNVDINLAVNTFPKLNVYAILPRVVEQNNNENLPR